MITLTITQQGNLLIEPDDLEALQEATDLYDAFDHATSNGWQWIEPEDIGALTCGEIISDEVEYDDNGTMISVGRVFWNSEYAVQSTLELLQKGEAVEWEGHTDSTEASS